MSLWGSILSLPVTCSSCVVLNPSFCPSGPQFLQLFKKKKEKEKGDVLIYTCGSFQFSLQELF